MRNSGAKRPSSKGLRGGANPKRLAVGVFILATVGLSSFAALGEATTTTAPATTATTAATTATTAPATTATTVATTGQPTTTAAGEPTTVPAETTTTLSDEAKRERARAVANLNLAKSNDVEIAAQLKSITDAANLTLERIDAAELRIKQAKVVAERAEEALQDSSVEQAELEASLTLKAVEGFKTRSVGGPGALFSETSVNETLRQNQLLDEASSSTTELLEDLRGLLEDRRVANAEAEQAAIDALLAEQELQRELENLKEQLNAQLTLKAEAESRVNKWASELTAYAREDAAIQRLIGQNAAPAPVNTGINNPTTPSALGFQWPLDGASVTSEYGYRIHPVYGSRKLHAGIDMGAARGTPIAASNTGVVIFAGVQGGYGRTVIVDHGGGITTLYAHMTEIGSVEGQTVERGDIVGFVGATGTATGNHLHFEVRVNGGAVNPRSYLP